MIAESAATSAMLAFVLGNRHGLDADHLAAIDGLARWNARAGQPLAASCGMLFSAGHAGIIIAISVVFLLMSNHLDPPRWLETTGTLISGGTLLLLGMLNLRAALDSRDAAPVGVRSRFMRPLLRASGAWQVALVGALFALSFDSVAIATLFAASKTALRDVLLTGASFAAGMLVVGAANGWWVVRLLRLSHHAGCRATRVMTLTVAAVTLLVSVRVLMPFALPASADWFAGNEWLISTGTVTALLAGYFISGRIVSRPRAEPIIEEAKPCAG